MGTAKATLSQVPTGIQCIVVSVSGIANGSLAFDVTPGTAPVTLELGSLPIGRLVIEGAAYDLPCSSVRARTRPRYASAARSAVIRENIETSIELTLRTFAPTEVTVDFEPTVVEVVAGGQSTYARLADGTVIAWGRNTEGQLGDGTTTDSLAPVDVSGLTNVAQVVAGLAHACALEEGQREPRCWGTNADGRLGRDASPSALARATTPAPIARQQTIQNGVLVDIAYTSLSAGSRHTCGISTGTGDNPKVRCWGSNDTGQVRENSTLPFYAAPFLSNCSLDTELVIAGRYGNVFGEGAVTRFGGRVTADSGSILRQDCTNSLSSVWNVAFDGLTAVDGAIGNFDESCLVQDVDGALWCWGVTQFGLNWIRSESVSGVVDIANDSQNVCVVLEDGRVFCRGRGLSVGAGQSLSGLSFGFVEARVRNIVQISGGIGFFCALDDEGAVWCWGRNDYGQLGDGTTFDRAVPVRAQL